MATAKFKVYSKRVNETNGAVVFGLSAVIPEKGDAADFGKKNVWGELQINCDPEEDAAEEFNVGDLVEVSLSRLSAGTDEDDEEDITPTKKKKTGATPTPPAE